MRDHTTLPTGRQGSSSFIPCLSLDINHDIWLWAHVKRFSSYMEALIERDARDWPNATIIPYCGEWIMQLPDGEFMLKGGGVSA